MSNTDNNKHFLLTPPSVHLMRLSVSLDVFVARINAAFCVFEVLQSLAVTFELLFEDGIFMCALSFVIFKTADAIKTF